MSWYDSNEKPQLDFSKPIMARNPKDYSEFILLPQLSSASILKTYEVIGYNWFCFRTGSYNSCRFYDNARAAVDAYKESGYIITNVEIKISDL